MAKTASGQPMRSAARLLQVLKCFGIGATHLTIAEISRDLLARLRYNGLIASGPRAPRRGAPHTFVTTDQFLATFDLETLRDLPELELEPRDPG